MKRITPLPLSELYDRMKPIDKLALLYFIDEMQKGRRPKVSTRYGHNAAIVLSYGLLLQVRQVGDSVPTVVYITSRGMAMKKLILSRTTPEALAQMLPEDLKKALKPKA